MMPRLGKPLAGLEVLDPDSVDLSTLTDNLCHTQTDSPHWPWV